MLYRLKLDKDAPTLEKVADRYTEAFNLRLTPHQKIKLKELAKENNTTVSEIIRLYIENGK